MLKKIISFLIFTLLTVNALAGEIYTVKAIKISASEKNSSLARNIAIEKGQIKAFHVLVSKYFPESENKLALIGQDTILNTISGFELSEEKSSATQYIAKMNVKFSKNAIDKLMQSPGVVRTSSGSSSIKNIQKHKVSQSPSIDTNAPPTLTILLVPVYEHAGQTYWFEDDNNWFEFWQRKMFLSDLKNKFTLPLGDIEDLKLLNKNILNKNIIDLNTLFERYGVNSIALVQLGKIENEPLKRLTLQTSYISRFNPSWQQHNFADLDGDNYAKLMSQAFEEVIKFDFNKNQISDHLFDITKTHTIEVELSSENTSDWVYFENSLTHSKYIVDLTLQKMNLKQSKYSLTYNISFLDLQLLLRKHNFNLQDNGDGKYSISREIF